MSNTSATGWPIAVVTAILLPIVVFLAYFACVVVANKAHGQTRPIWVLPSCDDDAPAVTDRNNYACILVSTEHWGGDLPRAPVVLTCLKREGVLKDCWVGGPQ